MFVCLFVPRKLGLYYFRPINGILFPVKLLFQRDDPILIGLVAKKGCRSFGILLNFFWIHKRIVCFTKIIRTCDCQSAIMTKPLYHPILTEWTLVDWKAVCFPFNFDRETCAPSGFKEIILWILWPSSGFIHLKKFYQSLGCFCNLMIWATLIP